MNKSKKKYFIIVAVAVIIVLCIFIAKIIYGGKPDYPEELETYVQKVIDQIDPVMRDNGGDPEYTQFKKDLYELKQAYPDKSYEELDEMLYEIETDRDFENLLKQGNYTSKIMRKYFIGVAVIVIVVLCILIAKMIYEAEPDYPEELETYVQKVREKGNSVVISNDSSHKKFKRTLYELKQIYPDKSYEELDKMRDGWAE